ncbi:MAG: hypothetical protein A3D94_03470 [Alphaproteobacteria bacterium RIFCSPHIGHO2_12_FULL_66_14]|jgi:hypothetical protein|nr:MAG: hypothetical protein A3D94_03470 [Alphaproteobacteria bacterium RIFCSPHIGHO2_12_FULL_66_14]
MMLRRAARRQRRLLSDRCGTVLVRYRSFMLLVAVGAITMLTQVYGGEDVPPDTPAISAN